MTFDRRQYERDVRHALERLDIIEPEDELPSARCQAAGCVKPVRYEWCGQWGVFWVCSEHRRLYADHDRIVSRVRSIRKKRYI